MADAFKLQIVTPERVFYEGEATMVELSTTEGDIGVYGGHIPMTAIVAPGSSYRIYRSTAPRNNHYG